MNTQVCLHPIGHHTWRYYVGLAAAVTLLVLLLARAAAAPVELAVLAALAK